jgi:hypothetical protein
MRTATTTRKAANMRRSTIGATLCAMSAPP